MIFSAAVFGCINASSWFFIEELEGSRFWQFLLEFASKCFRTFSNFKYIFMGVVTRLQCFKNVSDMFLRFWINSTYMFKKRSWLVKSDLKQRILHRLLESAFLDCRGAAVKALFGRFSPSLSRQPSGPQPKPSPSANRKPGDIFLHTQLSRSRSFGSCGSPQRTQPFFC